MAAPGQDDQRRKTVEVVEGRINFRCLREKCPESCCGPFCGVQRDIDSVEGRGFEEIVLTVEDSDRLLANGVLWVCGKLDDDGNPVKGFEGTGKK